MAVTSTLVDGGLLSNFPIDLLDRTDGEKTPWPSFGVTVLPNFGESNDTVIPALAPIQRFGGPHRISILDFDISDNKVQALHANGYSAAEAFLRTWDGDALSRFR